MVEVHGSNESLIMKVMQCRLIRNSNVRRRLPRQPARESNVTLI
jgi:hypothetical protein